MRVTPFTFLIDIPVRNEWANVDLLRSSVLNCFAAIFQDVDGSHAIAMVAGELLENAIKYGSWTDQERPFRLRVWGQESGVQVSVENPVDATSEHVEELQRALGWIRSFPSPSDAYRAKLLDVANQGDLGNSRLGLARIAYEGACDISAVLDGPTLRVTAQMALQ